MSDPSDGVYFLAAGDLHTGRIPTESLDVLFGRAAEIPNARFFAVAGDLTDSSRAEEYAILAPFINRLPMPFYGVMGNHDVASGNDSAARALFKRALGLEDASFRRNLDGVSFVFLSTEHQMDGCTVEIARSMPVLQEALGDGDGTVISFCHAPLRGTVGAMPGRPSFVSDDPAFGLPGSEDVRSLYRQSQRPGVWISGHTHSDLDAERLIHQEWPGSCPLHSVNLGSPYYTGRDGRMEAPILLYHFLVTDSEVEVRIEDVQTRSNVREERLPLTCSER